VIVPAIVIGLILALALGAATIQGTRRGVARILKLAASTSVIGLFFLGTDGTPVYMWLILGALAASWFGDLALTFDGSAAFTLGLFTFALAHVVYIAAFVVRAPVDPLVFALSGTAMVGIGFAILRWLAPHRPSDLRIPLIAYVSIISIMVTVAFATQTRAPSAFIALGASAFAVSDVLVAREQFVSATRWNRIIGLPLYFGAQTLFALTV